MQRSVSKKVSGKGRAGAMARQIGLAVGIFGAALTAHAAASECPVPPPGPRDIKAMGYYTDKSHSVIDPVKLQENRAMTKPLDDYTKEVADLSDRYLADHDVEAGQCALAWLAGWAHDGAMLGTMVHINNEQSDYLRQWVQSGAAISYLKTENLATPEQRALIGDWLKQVAVANLAYWDNSKRERNNHYYWTGVAVMASAVATDDASLLETAQEIYEKGIDDIEDDGRLPMEMARGKRALHYHNYALAPLVMMAEMARLKGLDWYAYRDHRIDRLAALVARGYDDSSWFSEQAGVPQEPFKADGDAGWVEFYRLRAPNPERFARMHAAGPFDQPRMGGNLTLMAQVGISAQK
jgi:poly(beta-D-mannuronate) lyase